LKYRREKTQPLQQAMLLAEHVATHHTQMAKDIVGTDQGTRTSNIQIGKVSPKTSTRLSYQSTSKGTVTSQDFIKFWGKFFAFVLSALIEIYRDLKLFESI
jgi:hypothetical protein